jgi:hypothetical protein
MIIDSKNSFTETAQIDLGSISASSAAVAGDTIDLGALKTAWHTRLAASSAALVNDLGPGGEAFWNVVVDGEAVALAASVSSSVITVALVAAAAAASIASGSTLTSFTRTVTSSASTSDGPAIGTLLFSGAVPSLPDAAKQHLGVKVSITGALGTGKLASWIGPPANTPTT